MKGFRSRFQTAPLRRPGPKTRKESSGSAEAVRPLWPRRGCSRRKRKRSQAPAAREAKAGRSREREANAEDEARSAKPPVRHSNRLKAAWEPVRTRKKASRKPHRCLAG